ncbi:hypothetical protein ACFW9N_28995 [Streptomyces sp. NPDC059496]|uniref:hypothetical protein n=1 Tax=Streptomyces sp. NPDC059496 TaxID=3346851 RepID=UPI00369F5FF3
MSAEPAASGAMGPPQARRAEGKHGKAEERPCELDRLPISAQTRTELVRLCQWYQSSIDWDDPPAPSPWPQGEWQLFRRQADTAFAALCQELGDGWQVEMTHTVWTG